MIDASHRSVATTLRAKRSVGVKFLIAGIQKGYRVLAAGAAFAAGFGHFHGVEGFG
jgi:hypothetical protein